ncbi:MAG: hypothetical protein Pg6B_08800 [Candidatus Azobacteroides pseudotrichonymphae]|nr:MAG: hypothetical protein Pg6B_08800 [Candidatus Azobacteroides pseudotrichonymphae]
MERIEVFPKERHVEVEGLRGSERSGENIRISYITSEKFKLYTNGV